MERPIFHHLEHRVQTHIFLCVLAYHLLVALEKRFLDHGVHTSWATLREQLSTHQVVTVVLPRPTASPEDPQGVHPGGGAPGDLPHPADSLRGHGGGEDLGLAPQSR